MPTIDYLNIRLEKYVYDETRVELSFTIKVNGKEHHLKTLMPNDDFVSNAEYMFEAAKGEFFKIIKENEKKPPLS